MKPLSKLILFILILSLILLFLPLVIFILILGIFFPVLRFKRMDLGDRFRKHGPSSAYDTSGQEGDVCDIEGTVLHSETIDAEEEVDRSVPEYKSLKK